MGVGRKEGRSMDGWVSVAGSYVSSKASPPKLNQRQPPGVTSQTPTHSSHKDMVWHSLPMTRQPQLSSPAAKSPIQHHVPRSCLLYKAPYPLLVH